MLNYCKMSQKPHFECDLPGMSEKPLYREAEYYGILDHVKAARKGPLNGNRLDCIASISGRATGDGTAIRASPDGGCCVAHGSMVHVYDWLMEEQVPLTLDYVNVNDVGFLSPNRVVICTCERGDRAGGMASFNIKTGQIEHKFQVQQMHTLARYSIGCSLVVLQFVIVAATSPSLWCFGMVVIIVLNSVVC